VSSQDSSGQVDEYTLAADFLPVVTTFYRVFCDCEFRLLLHALCKQVLQNYAWRSCLHRVY